MYRVGDTDKAHGTTGKEENGNIIVTLSSATKLIGNDNVEYNWTPCAYSTSTEMDN